MKWRRGFCSRRVLCACGAWPLFLLQSWPAQIRRIDVVTKVHLIKCLRCFGNRPFPSSPGPKFQNEGRCSAFDMEMIFHSHANKTHFQKKGCAPNLILKVRVFGTPKWPIWADVCKPLCQGQHLFLDQVQVVVVRPELVRAYIDLYRSKSPLWPLIGVADFLFSLFAATWLAQSRFQTVHLRYGREAFSQRELKPFFV